MDIGLQSILFQLFLVFSVAVEFSLYLPILLCVKSSMLIGVASLGTVIAYVYLYSN